LFKRAPLELIYESDPPAEAFEALSAKIPETD
jgi:hypothetical protein